MTTIINDPADQTPPASGGDDKKETVSYETHRKLLDEKKRVQDEKRKLEDQLAARQAEDDRRQKEELEKQGNFQKLLETERAEKKKLEEEHSSLIGKIQSAQKQSAVLKHITGNVPNDAVEKMLDVSGVAINEDGSVNLDTAKLVAQEFEKKFPYLILRDKQNGGLPSNAANGVQGAGKITHAEWLNLDSAEMKKRYNDVDWTTAK